MPYLLRSFFALLLVSVAASPGLAEERSSVSEFTMALSGDWMPTRRLSVYDEPPYLALIDLLRGADVAMGNMETLFHDYETFPMHLGGGMYVRSDPIIAQDLVWAGLDMVSRANNHAGDYGVEGMRLTSRYLDEAGVVHAGVGGSLREAREARFFDSARGRVALISVASTFPDHSRAGRSRGDIPARPGLSPLRFEGWFGVTEEQIGTVAEMLQSVDVQISPENGQLVFGIRFLVSDDLGVHSEPMEGDVKEIARVVGSARALADYTVVSVHSHETGDDLRFPAEFFVLFARRMIDAGADVVFAHGPHILRAIEIYKGKPIFYSLGNFVLQFDTTLRVPEDDYAPHGLAGHGEMADYVRAEDKAERYPERPAFWQSVLAVLHWADRRLDHIALHPISLWHGERPIDRGRPMLADPALGQQIIAELAKRSRPFGTEIDWRDDIGLIRLPSSQPTQ
jgi:poly-gamma-glutamate synthesis protein (capsule biosynthesis protein)